MKLKRILVALGLATVFVNQQRVVSQTTQQSPSSITTTSQDQQSLSVTIYNSNIGLVRDVRKINLQSGLSELKFMDVAAQINPATVHIKSLTSPAQFSVQEQNYEYDLLNPQKLPPGDVDLRVTQIAVVHGGALSRPEHTASSFPHGKSQKRQFPPLFVQRMGIDKYY